MGHRLGRPPLGVLEVALGAHRVREVVDGLDPVDRAPHCGGVLQVALDDLDAVVPGDVLELPGGPDEDPDAVAGFEEARDETTADVPGGPGDEDVHAGHGTRLGSG
ncbi:hypothetical protein GCM10017714_08560 [Curtobacterium pusillum]|nr:hypothetical protein GCM10017610_04040 [Curtobacterium pusillum]